MILLDTNVLSGLMQAAPDPVLLTWLDRQPSGDLWTTAISVFELRFGLSRLPEGQRRRRLEAALDVVLRQEMGGRIAELDASAATAAGHLAARRERAGRPVGMQDTLIAGIALSRRAVVATRNLRDFGDLDTGVVNPWSA
ncbi:type II toxin-antitoxin system VapC family toxin [Roseomonas sp. AR75]|uniref:type II toxin-antitoxin system VapC family toxin n=1 Tax=Roseomonas sp. AR75 TaxID=2562311 RepID=UPI0010C10746|nr:type II toxin-antitoxin system VapC family toxin [Roseomonas sp. AR75]